MFADTTAQQLYSAFLCGGLGLLWGIYADLLVVWRQLASCRRWVVFLQDLVWVITGAVVFFLLSLPLTGGRMRWYLFVGAAVGLAVWQQTAGRLFVRVVLRTVRWSKRMLRPIGDLAEKLSKKPKILLKKIAISCKKLLQFFWVSLYNKLDYYAIKRKEGDDRGLSRQTAANGKEKKEHLSADRPHRVRPVRHYDAGASVFGNSGERE